MWGGLCLLWKIHWRSKSPCAGKPGGKLTDCLRQSRTVEKKSKMLDPLQGGLHRPSECWERGCDGRERAEVTLRFETGMDASRKERERTLTEVSAGRRATATMEKHPGQMTVGNFSWPWHCGGR